MSPRPANVLPHEFRNAELVVLGIQPGPLTIQGTRPSKPVTCPYCGNRVGVKAQSQSHPRRANPRPTTAPSGTLAPHRMRTTDQPCPTQNIPIQVILPDPGDPSSARRQRGLRARKTRGAAPRTSARPRRAHKEYDDIHELNGERNNNHWRNSYGLIAEDSAGYEYLGAEGGTNSVRTFRGGRADGNRR